MSDLHTEIVNTTHALIIVLDAKGRIMMFNPACERASGYRFEEAKGRLVWDFLLMPEEAESVKAVFAELRSGHFPNTHENHWIAKSGEPRFIEWSNSAVTDESGRVTHVIGTGIDVTEKRAADRTLRASEAHFRDLAENLPLVFWVREMPSGRISYVSRAYEKIWGRRLGDLEEAYQSFVQSIHPDDRETLFRQMQRESGLNEPTETEYRIIGPDGAVRWIHSRAIPVQDETGQVLRIVGFADDITERKVAAHRLQEIQQRQKALLDSIPDAAWLIDAEGCYIEVNRNYATRWGIDPSDIIDRTRSKFLPAPIAAEIAAEDREIIATGKRLHVEKHRVIRGKNYWFEVIKTPITDATGKVTGIAGISRDITERKLAEAQRIAHDASLRASLVNEVHHRIKNNLQGVISLMQQLETGIAGGAALLDAVVARVNTIASMHGLFGAIDGSDLRLEQIILTLVSSLKVLYTGLPVRLSIRNNPQSVRVMESETVPLALIINELIMNAIKHSGDAVDGEPVEVALEGAGDCARIIIRSSAGRLPRHFDFDAGAGLGTGLSLVKSLLPRAGAALLFENNAGSAGAKVELTLRSPVIVLRAAGI
jgi:PAS domain S-box-containing protein